MYDLSNGSINVADGNCFVRILTTGPSDIISWYEIWEDVMTVYGICVRLNKGGIARGLGETVLQKYHFVRWRS